MTQVAEIVTFRLMPGTDPIAFTKAAAAMTPFFDRIGGVIARTLSCDANGLWTDHILWHDIDAATHAAKSAANAPEAANFMPMIDPSTTELRHARVHL